MITASVICKAEFYDLDPMQIVWHGNYLRFMEQARSALMDKIGFNYSEMFQSGYAFPIVDARVKYVKPVRLGEAIRVEAKLIEYENRLKIDYIIRNDATGVIHTKATTVQLAIEVKSGELSFVCPNILIEKVRRAMT